MLALIICIDVLIALAMWLTVAVLTGREDGAVRGPRDFFAEVWAVLRVGRGFKGPVPRSGLVGYDMAHLLLGVKLPRQGPLVGRAHHILDLIYEATSAGTSSATLWRWGRRFGPEVLLLALEVGLSREEWERPLGRGSAASAPPDRDALFTLYALGAAGSI